MTRHDGNELKIVRAPGGKGRFTFHQDKSSHRLHNTLTLTHTCPHINTHGYALVNTLLHTQSEHKHFNSCCILSCRMNLIYMQANRTA